MSNVTLYNGDCLDVLKNIENNSDVAKERIENETNQN